MPKKEEELTEEQLDEVKAYELPDFSDEEIAWMESALAVMSPKLASTAFLQKYPHYIEQAELNQQPYLVGEINRQVWRRFWNNRYHSDRKSYNNIQANIAEYRELKENINEYLRKFAKLLKFTDPFERLLALQEIANKIKTLKPSEVIKVIDRFEKFEREYLRDNADPIRIGEIENRHKVELTE